MFKGDLTEMASSPGDIALDARQRDIAAGIVPRLGALGVCPRCVLRFVGVSAPAQYSRPQADVWADLLRAAGADPDQPCAAEPSACCVCLGVLALANDSATVERLLVELSATPIGTSRFAFDVALPPSIHVRQRGTFLHVSAAVGRDAMPRHDAIIETKNVLKWQLVESIATKLGAVRDDSAAFHVTISVHHVDSDRESEAMVAGGPAEQGGKRQKLHDPSASSVRSVLKALFEPDCRARLERAGLCPPQLARQACGVSVSAFHAPICIGGRYNKYSREMPQTPWWLDNEKRGVSSVQEELQVVLLRAYGARASVFHGCGREDIDVRMLGSGRPFVLELQEPTTLLPGAEPGTALPALEAELNRDSEHVQVRALPRRATTTALLSVSAVPPRLLPTDCPQVNCLRVVPASAIADLVREGEAEHRKSYRCVVWFSRAVSQRELSEKLDNAGPVLLEQKTPIRVLHRRPLLTRPRTVFSMRSEAINEHYALLDLVTQSGTYVKEFVHGDFGRTLPNLGSLLGCSADILQLDVLAILDH